MILQALYELYDRLSRDAAYAVAPPGYSLQKIVFRVVLKPDGTLHAIEDARVKDPKGKPRPQQLLVPGHAKPSGSGLNPCFLWDTSAYMLGFKADDDDPDRTAAAFCAFRKKHLELESAITSPVYQAACRFLEKWDPKDAVNWPVLKEVGPGYGVFQILGEAAYVHDDAKVQSWWLQQVNADAAPVKGQCLVSGASGPIVRLQYKIKKVGGRGESQIVAFNASAFESYGKTQSFNAPICEDAAFRYATALNALLDGPMNHKHRFTLGDATVVFWTKEPTNTEDIFARFAAGNCTAAEAKKEAQDPAVLQKLELFLKALRQGREA